MTDNLAAAYDSRSSDDMLTDEAAAAVLQGLKSLKRQQTTSKTTSRRRARPHAQAFADDAGLLRASKLHNSVLSLNSALERPGWQCVQWQRAVQCRLLRHRDCQHKTPSQWRHQSVRQLWHHRQAVLTGWLRGKHVCLVV